MKVHILYFIDVTGYRNLLSVHTTERRAKKAAQEYVESENGKITDPDQKIELVGWREIPNISKADSVIRGDVEYTKFMNGDDDWQCDEYFVIATYPMKE